MAKNVFFKAIGFFVLLAGVSVTGAFAQITVSGGFALSRVNAETPGKTYKGETGFGGNIYLDYLLPIDMPLSLGGEIGIDTAKVGEVSQDTVLAVPILFRVAYHFDISSKIDLYLVGKIGYAIGTITSGPDEPYLDSAGGFAIGIDIGAAYYLTPIFGLFIEGGFDDYMIEAKFSNSFGYQTIDTPFYRFLTFGLSFKR
jgi:hypothetical protein